MKKLFFSNNYVIIEFPNILHINCKQFIIVYYFYNQVFSITASIKYDHTNDRLTQLHRISLDYILFDIENFI